MGTIRVIDERLGSNDELGSSHAIELAPGPRLLVSVGFRDAVKDCVWKVELQGAFSLVRFDLLPTDRTASGTFVVPTTLECVYRRSERRVSAPPAAVIRFLRENGGGVWSTRTLRDIGFGGLQFVTDADEEFSEGERLVSAEITWKHGPNIAILAQVRHVSESDASHRHLCGVTICPRTELDASTWYQEVSCLLHPDTMDAATVNPDQLWDLYAASGYFGLDGRDAGDFAHVKTAFTNASVKLQRLTDVSCKVVREHRGRVEATISLLRAWSGGWLACQIARRQERNPLVLSGNRVLRDIFLHAYESVQQHPSLRWHVTFVRKDARFSHLAYCDFAIPRIDGCSVAMVPFRAMQVFCGTARALEPQANFEIGVAEPCETRKLLVALACRFPVPYLEAYDFVPEHFALEEIRRQWDSGRLFRLRQVLVIRRKGLPLAAAILDMVEPGVHLVGLVDSVHMVALQPDGADSYCALLQAVQRFYQAHGRSEFMLFEESGDPRYATALGARDLGEADQIFVSGNLTAAFLDHINSVTAPLSSQVRL